MLLSLPFLIVVGLALPLLAWSSHRRSNTTDATETALPSSRALAWQTLVLQAIVAGLASLAVWGGGIDVIWLARLTAAGVLTAIGILVVALGAAWWEGRKPTEPGNKLGQTLQSMGVTDPVWLVALVAAAVSEEFAYRWVLTAVLSEPFGITAGAVGSAILFGVSHFGQGWRGAVLGAGFALAMQLLVVVSGGLSLAIIVHLSYDLGALELNRRLAPRESDEAAV